MTPADTLRAAAEKLRALADAAHGSPWAAVEIPRPGYDLPAWWVESDHQDPDGSTSATVADCPWGEADAHYIAAMHPGVATALAKWLEAEAAQPLTAQHSPRCTADCTTTAALTVARQILGSTS
ncbi:hypothetical protein MWG58_28905 [Streptomyces sp. WAC00276]|uniref:hypothetical protein n=1 Tax=Streptomyces sp. WAC00276 TaxID=2933778 RepID=UPI001FFE3F82|nr:hypothetical protein [Streptomyces sp. WAC00276]MCK2144864.1 hypothetical protein [Streptomyces sp. WAC00276]